MRTIRAPSNRIVPSTSNNALPLIIHIRDPYALQERPGAAKIDEWIAETGLEVQVCRDVYRGLARILRGGDFQIRAVVVCVDGLRADEFEFFTLVARHRREVRVYVYGRDRASPRVTRAMELGATGEATQAVIVAMKPPRHEEVKHEGAVEPERQVQAPARSHDAEEGTEHKKSGDIHAETAPVVDESAKVKREETSGSVRVPWLRYANRPARRGPQGRSTDDRPEEPLRPSAPAIGADITPVADARGADWGVRAPGAPAPHSSQGAKADPPMSPLSKGGGTLEPHSARGAEVDPPVSFLGNVDPPVFPLGKVGLPVSPHGTGGGRPRVGPDAPSTPRSAPPAARLDREEEAAHEPLLTEAELEALMSDDFDEFDPGEVDGDALARDEREMLTGDETRDEGGQR